MISCGPSNCFLYKMLETPLKCCSQKLTFWGAFETGAKAPVSKRSLKVFQNRSLIKFRNKLKHFQLQYHILELSLFLSMQQLII